MADDLKLHIKQLFSLCLSAKRAESRTEILDIVRRIAKSYAGLMTYLRNMMLGYENKEVQDLLTNLESMVYSKRDFFHDELKMNTILVNCEQLYDIRYSSNVEEEAIAGFDAEAETLLDQLTRTSTKKLQIISIAGMPGLGKTTLARKLFRDPLIKYMFDIRAWTCVSQVYLKKDLLLGILSSFINNLTDEIYKMNEEQLGEKLYRRLKDRKYLVVLDDIWDCKAWNDIRMYFPDDKTGSRVLFTSRDIDISLHVQAARSAHVLRLRTQDESWDIFMKKVFRTGICPSDLEEQGKVITQKCKGLPLAIVIAAGLLKNNWSIEWWTQIATSLSSFMVSDPSQYMDSLAFSYNHLPPHLRPCFLYLAAFPEDYEIPVSKLIRLWIAQGFIHQTGSRILEDVAEDILMDLIKRSLVMTPTIRANGQVKTCRIHDILRDFCLRKAKEESFLPNIYTYDKISSMLSYPSELGKLLLEGRSIHIETYKALKILDVVSIPISSFPCEAVQLINLRYLAIQAREGSPLASISNLVYLQTLVILSRKNVMIPKSIWNMVNLRHLYIKSGENLIEEPCFAQLNEKDGCPRVLASLQTLSHVSPRSFTNISLRTPNLRKLGFCGPLISRLGDLEFPSIVSLQHLQKLKLLNTIVFPEATRSCNPLMFPEKLKKLTLSNTGMDWEEMWTFAWLPNLEVLKLKFHACIGERWETGDAEFRRLKFLKLQDLDIREWVSSSDNFPRLQRLIVHRCLKLNSIPSDLGKIWTLDVIEVGGCSSSAHESALKIQKEQESDGNSFLKVHTKPEI
ncbi:putative P-loop containing nucleoside triphosphate hydrolase, leucine-rich repeat domain superfamily [Helianthus annuus]|nr:putative P-loop containing nucleoside triphosphate hydrolase, leucine-rich repeat domain superfamily [Helianthus annuus]